ncbi:hypothetical protein ACMD2_03133 [Ananas comosus]|uniref:Uncharacterized protein n=1 Tax=Ananas comosus TaxID=4615 RepID=A0A199VFP8_ANACO|nr:hypothetical protein ACMD2_03133 [Ananas comosus]
MEEREKKPREGRRLENSATKTITLTPTPSTFSSSRTPSTATWSRSDGRSSADSCYFPGCRKDANCNCDICLASIDATRDLVRNTALISPHFLTKLSSTKTPAKRSLLLPEPKSPPATPEFGSSVTIPLTPPVQFTPPARSTAKSRPPEKAAVRKERRRGVGCKMLSLLAGWLLLWAVDSGLSAAVLRGFGPKLTADVVRQFGEESLVYGTDLKGRLRILQQKIDGVVGGGLSNCGSEDSVWELKQEGHLFFHWRCVIYKSAAEEVSIWGMVRREADVYSQSEQQQLVDIPKVELRGGAIRSRDMGVGVREERSISRPEIDPFFMGAPAIEIVEDGYETEKETLEVTSASSIRGFSL